MSALPALLDRIERASTGAPAPLPRTALGLVLWENAAYLVPDSRRLHAYEALLEAGGSTAHGILSLPRDELRDIAALGGMMPDRRVEKLLSIANIVQDDFGGDLESALALPLPQARRALKRFPGIADPGADRILLFTNTHARPALESNGLRTLVRLGLAEEGKGYAATYRAGTAALAPFAERGCKWLQRAYVLLRAHGQAPCKNNEPMCDACPLADACPSAD